MCVFQPSLNLLATKKTNRDSVTWLWKPHMVSAQPPDKCVGVERRQGAASFWMQQPTSTVLRKTHFVDALTTRRCGWFERRQCAASFGIQPKNSMASGSSSATYTLEEVARHNTQGDAWVVIDGDVYDVSKFSRLHPGQVRSGSHLDMHTEATGASTQRERGEGGGGG